MNALRVVFDGAASAAFNMAVDEVLLDGEDPLVLRLYRWRPHALSLGYFQHPDEATILPFRAGGRDVVRRLTGGGAILHADELTYSLAGRDGATAFAGDISRSYELMHDIIIDVVAPLIQGDSLELAGEQRVPTRRRRDEPFLCFDRTAALDVFARGQKVLGSAKRRRAGRALQHGSLIFGKNEEGAARVGLRDLIGGNRLASRLAHAIARELARRLGLDIEERPMLPCEFQRAAALADEKYATRAWTFRRETEGAA